MSQEETWFLAGFATIIFLGSMAFSAGGHIIAGLIFWLLGTFISGVIAFVETY